VQSLILSIDDTAELDRRGSDDESEAVTEVDASEERRRLERLEREKWLKDSNPLEDDDDVGADDDSQFFVKANKALKALERKPDQGSKKAKPKVGFRSPTPKAPLQARVSSM
jgi:hypothetical protein